MNAAIAKVFSLLLNKFLEIGAVSAIAATALFCSARLSLELLLMLSLTPHLPER